MVLEHMFQDHSLGAKFYNLTRIYNKEYWPNSVTRFVEKFMVQ